jgi:hypothetical protein
MAHENCILLSNSTDLALVQQRLAVAFGESALQIEGPNDHWTKISHTRRKLLSKATVSFQPLDASKLVEAQKRLKHVFMGIPAENPDIQQRLLAKISTSRLGIDVQAPNGLRGLEETVFVVAEALDAVIFWQGSKMLDKKGRLILDFEGRSGVRDLEVWVDSTDFDAKIPVTEDGTARKEKTEAFLKAKKIPFAKSLPPIEGEKLAKFRTLEEVTGRVLALMVVAVKGEGLEDEIVHRVIEKFGIAPFLSPAEQEFIQDSNPTQQDKINFIWRYESLWALLWALGHIETLPFPDQICDVPKSVGLIHDLGSLEAFTQASRLRSPSELLDQCDLAYRLHWAVVDARLRGEAPPAKIEAGVSYERHYALNWLRCYDDQDWDEVGTDT